MVRLAAIDAPERDHPLGRKSTEHPSELVAGQSVLVDWQKRGRSGRIFVQAFPGDEHLELTEVKARLAWHGDSWMSNK